MAVYLINFGLILFWRLFFIRRRFPNGRKYFCSLAAFQWILISGLRDWSVGADTYAYYQSFETVKTASWGTLLGNLTGCLFRGQAVKDPGYAVLTKLFQLFSGSYQLFLTAIAVVFMTLMGVWIYKHSASPCTSFLLFSTLFYSFYAITGHRQTLATALMVFLGYDLIRQRKFWKFAAVAVAAFLLHKSSLVFAPVYFLASVPVTAGCMLLWMAGILTIVLLGKRLYVPIALLAGYSEEQIHYAGGGAELYAVLLVTLCILIWILYPRLRHHRVDAGLLFHINALTLLSGLLVLQNQSFMRIQQYFSLFLMLTVPEVINTVRKEHRLPGYLLFGAVMILYLMGKNPQYQFFFMG